MKDASDILEAQINNHLYKSSNTKPPYKLKPSFSPSQLGHPCLRRLYYSYLRVESDTEIQAFLARIFSTGKAIGDLLYEWLKATGYVIDYRNKNGKIPISRFTGKEDPEFPIKEKDLEVKGKIDAVCIIDGKLWLVEFKSMKTEDFKELKNPLDEHITQGMSYVYVFEKNLVNGDYSHINELNDFRIVEGIIYVYFNKNNSFLKKYLVRKNWLLYERIKGKIQTIKQAVREKRLPEKNTNKCKFCPFEKKCKRDYKVTI